MTCAQPTIRSVAEDVVLGLAFVLLVLARPEGALFVLLLAAIPLVIAFRIATLHFPSRVVFDDSAIAFSAYARTHTFAWRDVERVHVRRFLVKDRVLVRIAPASVLRGRYWLTSGMHGYEALVAELERRRSPPRT